MAQDNDEINEARRKALRNGEEDPVVVAQRYLNIYRQMHIFPPERKAAFDKMLVDVPVSIRGILGSLPGGLMLQDYINELLEKNGESATITTESAPVNKPILETIKEQASQNKENISSPSPSPQPVQVVQGGNMEISLGKDFSEQFAQALDVLLAKQSAFYGESMEKLSADMNRNQQTIVEYMTQSKETEKQIVMAIAKVLEQRQNISQENNDTVNNKGLSGEQLRVMQQLIDGQKEINLRLNKMESTALSQGAPDNQELIKAMVASNIEAIQKITSAQVAQTTPSSIQNSDNTEHLLELIEQSQAKLIEGVAQRILQNNTAVAQTQANNNANNIQINTPDTSAQTMLLINKIADLQASGEKNMETAISRLIEAQKEIYRSIDNNRSQEIAEAIVKGLQNSSLTINNYASDKMSVAEIKKDYPAPQQPDIVEATVQNQEILLSEADEDNNYRQSEDNYPDEAVAVKPKKKKKKKKKSANSEVAPNINYSDIHDEYVQTETSPVDNYQYHNIDSDNQNINDDISQYQPVVDDTQVEESNILPNTYAIPNSSDNELAEKSFTLPEEVGDVASVDISSLSGSDWGFNDEISTSSTNVVETNNSDNIETIGNNSYIYVDDEFHLDKTAHSSPIVYDTKVPQMQTVPQIYDDEDENEDPYLK